MKNLHRLLAACAASLLLVASARAADWTEDYPAALARAKQEHKLLLLDFTGSDWCIWCKRLGAEILDTPKFKDFADQKLVLVTVDFPNAKVQSEALKAQNKSLAAKYSVEAPPTLIILDPDEQFVFKQEGYLEGGPDALIALFPKDRK
jgi:thioredoxin-related protein